MTANLPQKPQATDCPQRIWEVLRAEAEDIAHREPALSAFLKRCILGHDGFAAADAEKKSVAANSSNAMSSGRESLIKRVANIEVHLAKFLARDPV